MPAAEKVWIITTSDERPIREIAQELAEAGLQDGQVLEAVGCITGAASDQVAAKLRQVRGVLDVSVDTSIDVGPPDAKLTW